MKNTTKQKLRSNIVLRTGTYRHYRKNAAGELVFIGEVEYTYEADKLVGLDQYATDMKSRNEDELARRLDEAERFEAIADAACEGNFDWQD